MDRPDVRPGRQNYTGSLAALRIGGVESSHLGCQHSHLSLGLPDRDSRGQTTVQCTTSILSVMERRLIFGYERPKPNRKPNVGNVDDRAYKIMGRDADDGEGDGVQLDSLAQDRRI